MAERVRVREIDVDEGQWLLRIVRRGPRSEGIRRLLTRRWVKNDRLNHAGYLWAFSAITASPGAKAH